jgi:hypothetical protein
MSGARAVMIAIQDLARGLGGQHAFVGAAWSSG